jgi:flagellar biogenesis protein FliO
VMHALGTDLTWEGSVSRGFLGFRTAGVVSVFLLLCFFFLVSSLSVHAAEDNLSATASDSTSAEEVTSDQTVTEGEETAPDYEYTEPDFDQNRTSYPLLILRTVAVLAVIVIVIYLIFRFLLRSRNRVIADTEMIRVLATFPLAANRLIKVVDIAGKILVLGVTDANITLITEVEDKELVDRIRLLSSKEGADRGSFKEQFLKLLGGRGLSRATDAGQLRGYRDRINRMKKL